MNALLQLAAPIIICCVCLCGLVSGVDVFSALIRGAKDGLRVTVDILPALLILFPAVYMLRSSGLIEDVTGAVSPLLSAIGIPAETAGIMLLRPFTGSGAMAAAADVMKQYGADSTVGRTAAVMLGSSETTFYVISVYFGAAGVKNSRWAVPAALIADIACFISSAWAVRMFFGT